MNNKQFEAWMRLFEYYHNTVIVPDVFIVVRVDGRAFTGLTKHTEKPFDLRFANMMSDTAEVLVEELNGIYAYTYSDEISVLLPKNYEMFGRSHEKLVSISAAVASSFLSSETKYYDYGGLVQFDSRVVILPTLEHVVDYMHWRMSDATRNCINSWAHYTLIKHGYTPRQAHKQLENKGVKAKNELLFQFGINFNDLPLWQRRGIGIYWKEYDKKGFNPISKEEVITKRRELVVDGELPIKEQYEHLIKSIIERSSRDLCR